MKLVIEKIGLTLEEEIILRCHEVTEEVKKIIKSINFNASTLVGQIDDKVFSIDYNDIYYIESIDNKTFVYSKENIYECKLRLYELEEELPKSLFFRCSKSMILNCTKIKYVKSSVNSRFDAKLKNDETVIISRQYVPSLKKMLGL